MRMTRVGYGPVRDVQKLGAVYGKGRARSSQRATEQAFAEMEELTRQLGGSEVVELTSSYRDEGEWIVVLAAGYAALPPEGENLTDADFLAPTRAPSTEKKIRKRPSRAR